MKNKKHFPNSRKLGIAMGAALLAVLTEFTGTVNAQAIVVTVPAPVPGGPVVVAPAVVSDNYVYYPNYGVYYNSHRHQYYYLNGGAWITTPEPFGVSAITLQASPWVNMDFHDFPARHHAEMMKQYPKNWHSDVGHSEKHDDHRTTGPEGDKKKP